MLRRDGVALEHMSDPVLNRFPSPSSPPRIFRCSIRRGDYFAESAFLEESDSPSCFAHLLIRCAFQIFGPGLVDDVGDFLAGELATDFRFLPLYRQSRSSTVRESLNQPGDTPSISKASAVASLIADSIERGPIRCDRLRSRSECIEHVGGLQSLPALLL